MPVPARRLPTLSDLVAFAANLQIRTVSRWVGLGLLAGVGAGLGAAAFFVAMDFVRHQVLAEWAHLSVLEPYLEHSLFGASQGGVPVRTWLVVMAPALGGLLSGIIVTRLAPEAEGHGTDALIDSFHTKRALIRKRIPFVKALASVILIGTGGSAGREGPIAQIGAGLGSLLARTLGLSVRERRLLLLAGAGGGIAAIFRSPLGGALFVVEVLYRDDFEVEALVPAVFSSVTAYSVFTLFFGQGAIFATEAQYAVDPRQLPFYLLMAAFASLVGLLYIKFFYGLRDHVFAKLRVPAMVKPMLGGLGIGLLALAAPQALGAGYGWLQAAILSNTDLFPTGWYGALVLLAIAGVKILSTSLSISSGGSGGVFGPSVVIGGMVGGACGHAFHAMFPTLIPQPGAFVLVGMGCFFGGVAHVPISSMVMVSEMTGSYDLLVPIMLGEAVTFAMLRPWSLYEKQLPTRQDSPAHGGEYVYDVLQHIAVRDAFSAHTPVVTVSAATPLAQFVRQASRSPQAVFPVLSESGAIQGVVSVDDVRAFFFDEDLGQLAIAADCTIPLVAVTPEDSLALALTKFASTRWSQLPVVSAGEKREVVVGMLTYEELLQSYSRELGRLRQQTDQTPLPSS